MVIHYIMNYYYKIGLQAFRIPESIDSPLTGEGHLQSIELGQSWKKNLKLNWTSYVL